MVENKTDKKFFHHLSQGWMWALFFLLIVVLGFGAYANVLHGEFQFDDMVFIVQKEEIRDITNISNIWHAIGHPSRFIAFYTFALNYHWHGLDVFGYHVVNFVVHIINAFLIFILVLKVFETPRMVKRKNSTLRYEMACFTALLFLVHPIQTQAVSYISQRFASLATMFYLGALCCYIQARLTHYSSRRYPFFIACVLLALLGMFTKQIVFTLPFMMGLIEVCFFSRLSHLFKNWFSKRFLIISCGFLFFVLLIPSFFSFDIKNVLFLTTPSGSHYGDIITQDKYLLAQFRVLVRYLCLMIFPVGQNLYYDFPLSKNFFQPATLSSFVLLMSLFVLAIRYYRKHILFSFGVIWFFMTSSVESSIIPIHHVIFEHRMYLPSVGLFLSFSYVISQWIHQPKMSFSVYGVLVVILFCVTIQRNQVWQTEIGMWQDVVAKSPGHPRAQNNLGYALAKKGKFLEALPHYNEALRINPNYSTAYNNRGVVFLEHKQYDLAEQDFHRAVNLDAGQVDYLNNRGLALMHQKKYTDALHDFDLIIKNNPKFSRAYDSKGNIFYQQQRYAKAIEEFNRALALNPDSFLTLYNRGTAYAHLQKYDLALQDFDRVLVLHPTLEKAYLNRGITHLNLNRYDLALSDFDRLIALNPHNAKAYHKKGDVYLKQKALDQSIENYTQAIQLDPQSFESYFNRGVAYIEQQKYDMALVNYKEALEVRPGNVQVYAQMASIFAATKEHQRALALYNSIIQSYPQEAKYYYFRSRVFAAVGQLNKATQDAKDALRLGYSVDRGYLKQLKDKLNAQKMRP